jgi:hypothetical protein
MYRLHGEPQRALALLRAALGERFPPPAFIPHLAESIADVEGPEAALAWLRSLVSRDAASQPAHHALAVMLLSVGSWGEGWAHYLWRTVRPALPEPLPLRLDERRILLRGEYGLGDVLFFLRFVPELRERGASVALQLPAPLAKLKPLLNAEIALDEASKPDFEVRLPDLPGVLRGEGTPPAFELRAEGAGSAHLRERLARLGPPPYVGITWRAGTDLRRTREIGVDHRVLLKEITPALLGRALRGWPGTVLSLQRAPAPQDLQAVRDAAGAPVHDLSALNEDLVEMLALLGELDEYVAVSNTNIHLLAGLGRSARVLVPHPPEWRWMRRDGRSDWFPAFSVYRQSERMDWTEPLKRLREDLFARAGPAPRARA